MPSISRRIKNILYSRSTPDFLFSLYFKWKNEKDKKQLYAILDRDADLLENIEPGVKAHWVGRIETVLDSPDNKYIPRHQKAGQFVEKYLTMHNGIQIDPLSYYHYPMLQMLVVNKGVHEPQEEKVFQEVLGSLTGTKKKTMLELGSYWSFYSIWFKKTFPNSSCVMVEPNRRNLLYGKQNFKLNNINGTFIHSGISNKKDSSNNLTTVDEICAKQKIDFLDILHSDIQGFELDMLHGAQRMLSQNKVGYAFISTHSNELHENCKALLEDKYQFSLVASANLDESFSWDGILVMKAPNYPGVEKVAISKRILKNKSEEKSGIN